MGHDVEHRGAKNDGWFSVPGIARLYWESGVALIASAAFLFSCTSLAVKLLGDEVPTFQVVLAPGFICFLATSVVVKINGLSVRSKSWRVAGLTLLRGLLGATSISCFYLAIELLPLQDAVTLFFCSPVIATLLELAVTGEPPGWASAAATACTVAGVVLVAQPHCVFHHHAAHSHQQVHGHEGHGNTTGAGSGGLRSALPYVAAAAAGSGAGITAAGAALATIAAIANAAAFVVVRLLRQSQSSPVLTWWYHLVVVAVSAIPLALGYPAPPMMPSRRGCMLLLGVGLTQFGGQLLLNRGFQLESATRGSAINVLQVLFSFLWDLAVLGDKPGIVSLAGSSLVAAGVLCVAVTGISIEPRREGSSSASTLPRTRNRRRTHHRPPHADGDTESGSGPASDVEEPLVRTGSRDDFEYNTAMATGAAAAAAAATSRAGGWPEPSSLAAAGGVPPAGVDVVADGRARAEVQVQVQVGDLRSSPALRRGDSSSGAGDGVGYGRGGAGAGGLAGGSGSGCGSDREGSDSDAAEAPLQRPLLATN